MTATLLIDVTSGNRKLYGKAGETVKVISDKGSVIIAEDAKGNRFPVSKEKLKTNES